MRPIGVATLERLPQFPDIPTFHEQGVKGFEVNSWTGVVAPAKTGPELTRRAIDLGRDDTRPPLEDTHQQIKILDPIQFLGVAADLQDQITPQHA